MSKVKLMTQSEYAKHRGCSGVSVHKAVKAKRISLIDGKIDPAVADIQWSANTRARASAHKPPASTLTVAPGLGASASQANVPDPGPGDKSEDYWESRSRREKAEAAIAEMKEAEMRGGLIRVDAVRTAWAGKVTSARDALLQIPSRLAPVLAAETDLDRVTELLEAELRQALTQMSTSDAGEAKA